MEYKCEPCNRNFNSQESLDQHNSMKHGNNNNNINEKNEGAKINFKKYFIFIIIAVIIVLSVLSIMSYTSKPGEFDEFAQCLKDKGAIIYGNDYCQYTVKQLNFFGKSQKLLNYVKCIDNQALCDSKGVKVTPTWEIDGKTYPQVQTFESLSAYSGCELQ